MSDSRDDELREILRGLEAHLRDAQVARAVQGEHEPDWADEEARVAGIEDSTEREREETVLRLRRAIFTQAKDLYETKQTLFSTMQILMTVNEKAVALSERVDDLESRG